MSATTRIAFIGLGQMGKHMARNLLGPDVSLTVCNRSGTHFEEFRALGAGATTEIAELAGNEFIFLCLPGDAAVSAVLRDKDGLLPRMRKGQIVVDCSTTSVAAAKENAAALAAAGVDFLDAPVSGMEARAKDGTLSVMVGGNAAVLAKAKPYLGRMGNKILHVGGTGCGQLTKLVNQLLLNANLAALAEVLPLAVKLGLDPVKTGEIINNGTGRSHASEVFIPKILENRFCDSYPMRHAYKDMANAAAITAGENIPLPVVQAAALTYRTALLQGYGDEDKSAMIKVYEKLLGVAYRKKS